MNLALNLNALGMPSVIVNTDPESLQQPRGSTQNSRTMEHYRRLGLARAIRKLGLPADHPTDVTYSTRTNGWELARIAMPSENEKMRRVREAAVTDQVPEPILRCNQMYVEDTCSATSSRRRMWNSASAGAAPVGQKTRRASA
jgi:2-polyprenyl-6-methoxyphenol hydroxylase-like FAD-dependent oxidoreductase